MATYLTKCSKCNSYNITTLNPELKKTSKSFIVHLNAKCNDCDFLFTYPSSTASGRKKGIKY